MISSNCPFDKLFRWYFLLLFPQIEHLYLTPLQGYPRRRVKPPRLKPGLYSRGPSGRLIASLRSSIPPPLQGYRHRGMNLTQAKAWAIFPRPFGPVNHQPEHLAILPQAHRAASWPPQNQNLGYVPKSLWTDNWGGQGMRTGSVARSISPPQRQRVQLAIDSVAFGFQCCSGAKKLMSNVLASASAPARPTCKKSGVPFGSLWVAYCGRRTLVTGSAVTV
jgi:hypothetical protein